MKISIGADHAGYALKEKLRELLTSKGYELLDRGTSNAESADYPDFAVAVGEDVSRGDADYGILVCSTGVGMSIAANKVPGVRAALAWNAEQAKLTREHNDANVLALSARYLNEEDAKRLVDVFLHTEFTGGRHTRRLGKITATEERYRANGIETEEKESP